MGNFKSFFIFILFLFSVVVLADPVSMLPAVCILKGKNGAGTGFFAEIKGQLCIITNNHVLLELENVEIIDVNGKKISYDHALISPDRDLAYIPIRNYVVPGSLFQIHPAPEMTVPGTKVEALGNSLGGNVLVSAKGKFLGAGPGLIEVDAPFVPGNSGGPVILHKTDQVIGVATHAEIITNPEVTLIGSRYEVKLSKPAIRRFATRIDDIDLAKLERITVEQIRADYVEFSKITKIYQEIETILKSTIDPAALEKLSNLRFTFSKYRTTRKWYSTYLGKEYEKKYKLLDDFLKKIFPGDEYNFSIPQAERQEKLKKIWNRHRSDIRIKTKPVGFLSCPLCKGIGGQTQFMENAKSGKVEKFQISKTNCPLCNGQKKFPTRPAVQYAVFSKAAIGELTSVIEPEKREICGLRLGSDCVQSIARDKKYKKNNWRIVHDGCFRILRYPGNPTFPQAAETRFYFFGKKLMRVELYFPITNEKNAVSTEINFYKKYLPGGNVSDISTLLRYHQKIKHPLISNGRVHLTADVFSFFYNKMKNQRKMQAVSPQKQIFASRVPEKSVVNDYSYFPEFISEEDFWDQCGTFMRHRTFGRGCICGKNGVEVKTYLQLTVSHPDYDFVKSLLKDSSAVIQF